MQACRYDFLQLKLLHQIRCVEIYIERWWEELHEQFNGGIIITSRTRRHKKIFHVAFTFMETFSHYDL
jgi:hypothetical protein